MNKSGFVIVTENGLYGLEDANGHKIIPYEYDKILDYDDDGYIRLLKGDVYSTITVKGKKAIPLSKGLTHLGVFWGGTARARKGNCWGLVDVHGNAVSDFTYKQINAHHNNGYFAIDQDGIKGWLLENGRFSPFRNQTSAGKTRKFQMVRVFHHGIAPALTWEGKWVFVNEQLERVNNIEYEGLDPVLRNGIYSTWKNGGQGYGAAFYDGRPIVDIWFQYPLHFENCMAVCCIDRADGNDREPTFRYGILYSNGTWLFPAKYSSIHWNDYTEKDCWYAEDENVSYLLFPDGSRKVYDKSKAVREWPNQPFIPKSETNKDIPEEALQDKPKAIAERHLEVFNKNKFEGALGKYTGQIFWEFPLQFYYRDTDAKFDIGKNYKAGRVIRAGDFLEATEKLQCPIHKVRFMIAAPRLFSVGQYLKDCPNALYPFPFKENIIHRNTYFVVMDVFSVAKKTQILLLKIPHGAYVLGKKYGYRFRYLKAYSENFGMSLKEFARIDFQRKMSQPIHGHSLDNAWSRAMHRPVGLDKSMKPVAIEPDSGPYTFGHPYGETEYENFERYYDIISDDNDYEWKEAYFKMEQKNSIKVIIADITKLRVDAIVNAANTSLLGGGGVDGAIHSAAGPNLLEECRTLKGCETGQSKMTDAYDLPCSKIIHTVGPVWRDGNHNEEKLLASCYSTALDIAIKNKFSSIAFPCISTGIYHFPKKLAAQTALDVICRYLKTDKYKGDVILCCFHKDDAEIYKSLL